MTDNNNQPTIDPEVVAWMYEKAKQGDKDAILWVQLYEQGG